MPFDATYHEEAPSREDIDQSEGPLVLEFGANWCGHCQGLSPKLQEIFQDFPQVGHIRVADGKGKRLGRSFRVKLWPTLIFLRDGEMIAELVRPSSYSVREAFEKLTGS